MKQTIFETRQKADELMKQAIAIWKQSNRDDELEGLENDPVFGLLLTAFAHQALQMENELEHLREELLRHYAELQTPFEALHAIPATAVVSTALQGNAPSLWIEAESSFQLSDAQRGSSLNFLPVLRTRVINASFESVTRLDGRRWRMNVIFHAPVSNLEGLCFGINSPDYRELKLFVGGRHVPLITAADLNDLPLTRCFSADIQTENGTPTYQAAAACFDLFARQSLRLYYIKDCPLLNSTRKTEFVLQFEGITDKFVFDKEHFFLNTVLLANAKLHSVNLTSAEPIQRICGLSENNEEEQYLHLLPRRSEQLYRTAEIEVRRIQTDRFSLASLTRLLALIINKYDTDPAPFMTMKVRSIEKTVRDLRQILGSLLENILKNEGNEQPGVYLLLRQTDYKNPAGIGVEVEYLTTDGARANPLLEKNLSFSVPMGLDYARTQCVSQPVPGIDELRGETAKALFARYHLASNDRIVTPADIKLFCQKELMARYAIEPSMIASISTGHRPQMDHPQAGYEIVVHIRLNENERLRKGFSPHIPQAEIILQKMIEVRSTQIYPIHVSITFS